MLSDPAGPAADLLAAVQARYELEDVAPTEKLPGTHSVAGRAPYLAHGVVGQVAVDAAGLIVHMVNLAMATTTTDVKSVASDKVTTHTMSFSLRLMRPHPAVSDQGRMPSASAITTASLILVRDASRLVDACTAWGAALPAHMVVAVSTVEPIGPLGEYAGNRLTVSLGPM